jgi:cAMP-binding proteins - catabolite gene activator and regulatory subunit of cAMP-dependent protein kinases
MLPRMAKAPVELIEKVPLFSDLDKRELKEIADSMKERTFKAGDTVTEEGKGGAGFFVIDDGNAKVSVAGQEVRTLGAGDYFGEIGLIADIDRTATITAETDLRCYGMTFWDFRPLVETNASIAWKLLQSMAQRLKEAEQGR